MLFPFFFLMIRRPPRSTLFPSRRSSDLPTRSSRRKRRAQQFRSFLPSQPIRSGAALSRAWPGRARRSEEHTSELQSRRDLVCRLLLEKKKNKQATTVSPYMQPLIIHVQH